MSLRSRIKYLEKCVAELQDRVLIRVYDEGPSALCTFSGGRRFTTPPLNRVVLALAKHCGLKLKYVPGQTEVSPSFKVLTLNASEEADE